MQLPDGALWRAEWRAMAAKLRAVAIASQRNGTAPGPQGGGASASGRMDVPGDGRGAAGQERARMPDCCGPDRPRSPPQALGAPRIGVDDH